MMHAIAKAQESDARGGEGHHEHVVYIAMGLIARLTEGEVGLIGNEDQRIAGVVQPAKGGHGPIGDAKTPRRKRGFHRSGDGVEDRGIEHAIAVEKDCGTDYSADSHFISLAQAVCAA